MRDEKRLEECERKLEQLYKESSKTYDDWVDNRIKLKIKQQRLERVRGKGKFLGIKRLIGKKHQQKDRIVDKIQDQIDDLEELTEGLHRKWDSNISELDSVRTSYLRLAQQGGVYNYAREKAEFFEEEYPIYGRKGNPFTRLTTLKILTIGGFLFSLIFLSSNITGNAVVNLNTPTSNIIGVTFLLIGIIAAFFYFKNQK